MLTLKLQETPLLKGSSSHSYTTSPFQSAATLLNEKERPSLGHGNKKHINQPVAAGYSAARKSPTFNLKLYPWLQNQCEGGLHRPHHCQPIMEFQVPKHRNMHFFFLASLGAWYNEKIDIDIKSWWDKFLISCHTKEVPLPTKIRTEIQEPRDYILLPALQTNMYQIRRQMMKLTLQ